MTHVFFYIEGEIYMAINEEIVTGRKFRKLLDEATRLWQRISFWTKACDVEFDDGKNAEEKIEYIQTKITQLENSINSSPQITLNGTTLTINL